MSVNPAASRPAAPLAGPRARRGWDAGRLPERSILRHFYMTVRVRFALTMIFALIWATVSAVLATRWISDLAAVFTLPGAILLVAGIAVIPGWLNAQLVAAIFLDRPRPLDDSMLSFPSMTLLIAAYNEEESIARTIQHARRQDYPGPYEIWVIDDGSTDRTREIVRFETMRDPRIHLVEADHGGKAQALNAGLQLCRSRLVASVDADTLLMPQSLRRATARLLLSPPDTAAVAGDVLVRNPRRNLITRMQDWDYVLGIASVKRQQGLVRGTLVAQGAFSVFDARRLRKWGGWPDMIGEDIVMTWSLFANRCRVVYEPTAIAFTDVPETFRALARQRKRWARGMIEGLRAHGAELIGHRKLYSYAVGVNWGFPYLDFAFTCFWIPGLILALTGNFMIVGPMTLAVLPLNALVTGMMYRRQREEVEAVGLSMRRNFGGLVAYFFLYQLIMSPVSVAGYAEELVGRRRKW